MSVMVSSSAQSPPEREASTGELVKQLSEQVSTLVRDELKMARLELARKGKFAGFGVVLYGASGLVALYAVGCLVACAVIAISGVVTAWLAALIIGVVIFLCSFVLLGARARRRRPVR